MDEPTNAIEWLRSELVREHNWELMTSHAFHKLLDEAAAKFPQQPTVPLEKVLACLGKWYCDSDCSTHDLHVLTQAITALYATPASEEATVKCVNIIADRLAEHRKEVEPTLKSESWLRKAADEEDKHASIAVGVPPADEWLRAEVERLREEIKAKDNRILSLIVENRQPHPERDFVKECNEALAAKNKYIAELERQVGEAHNVIRGLVDELESPSMRRATANARTILAPPQTEGA